MDMLERRAPFSAGALAGHRRPRPRRAVPADLWRADLADRRALRAGHRAHDRRRARHAGRLFPRPVRVARGRQHGRAAGVSAAGLGAGRDRLSRPIDPQHHLDSRRARHSRLHAGRARGNADAGASANSSSPRRRSARRMPASCCASCCPMSRCRCSPSSCSASPSPSWSRARLSFLGLGVPPPISSWGSMIGEGRESLDIAPWLAFLPAIVDVPDRAVLQSRRRYAAGAHRSASGRAVTGSTLLSVEDVVGRSADAARQSARGRSCRSHSRRRANARRCRRIRLRQDHAVARDPAIAAEERKALRPRDVRRPRPGAACRRRSCASCAAGRSRSCSRTR